MRRLSRHLTYSNLMVTALAFVVFGGIAYAAAIAPKNSVVSSSIKNGQVKDADVAQPAVHSAGLSLDASGTCGSVSNEWASALGATVGYYRDVQGDVHLQGIAESCGSPASSTHIFVLPPGFRPSQPNEYFAVYKADDDTMAALWVDSSGIVRVVSASPDDKFALDGVTFLCGPSGTHGCP